MKKRLRKTTGLILWALLALTLLCSCDAFGGAYRKQVEQGRLQYQRGQYEAAIATYTAAVQRNARRPDAYAGRADVYAVLAGRVKAYSAEQTAYRRAALLDYKKAYELDKSAPQLKALTDYYLRLGDEALAALGDEDAPTGAYGYEIADSYYQAALDADPLNGPAYGRVVALLLLQDRADEAAELLRKALALTSDPVLTQQLQAFNEQVAAQEAEARRADALRVLSVAPYYGDPEQCRMSAEQALACAKLISDGVKGKFYGFSGYGKPLYDKPVYWDEPYPVVGYGSYETDRGKAILADLAGNGVPYLCLFSTLTDDNSFEVYGWRDGEMQLTVGEESWGGQQNGVLRELSDGSAVLAETMSAANNSRSGQTFRFLDGGAVVTESWYEARENGETVVRVTRDGTQLTYPRSQWQSAYVGVSPDSREAPYASLSDVISGACPLRDMVTYLDEWAAAISGGASETVEVPPEHSARHRMATAMLHKLFALDHLAIDADTRLCYVRLNDCNGDGMDELIAAFAGTYQSESGAACQFALYEWRDGELLEHPGGNNLSELRMARDRKNGIRGVLGIENRGTLTRYAYTFLNATEEFQADSAANRYEIIKHGETAPIAESEYKTLTAQYEPLERLWDFSQPNADRNYEKVVTSLYNMRN